MGSVLRSIMPGSQTSVNFKVVLLGEGAVLVYDITDEDSFQKVKVWVKELRRMVGPEINLIIAGNKIDLERKRTVNQEMAETFAASVNAVHIQTSAKKNEGIDNLFETLTNHILSKQKKSTATVPRQTIKIVDDDEVKTKSRCC